MKIKLLPYVLKYYFPSISGVLKKYIEEKRKKKKNNRKIANSRYCYSVWLRHLSILNKYSLNHRLPEVTAELGPGDSIGVGLMSLLTGAKHYYALDVVQHTDLKENVSVVDELVELLLYQNDIPNDEEFPRLYPRLDSYDYPSRIITEQRLMNAKDREWIQNLKGNLQKNENFSKDSSIKYFCPWCDSSVINESSVDMIFSQAVLEHVDDLYETYKTMSLWLKHGGVMSHQIDFQSHGTAEEWNGHWSYSDFEWKLIKGRRTYGINRAPLSVHVELLNKTGFKILAIIPVKNYSEEKYTGAISRDKLSRRFNNITEEDFSTCSAHILAIKK